MAGNKNADIDVYSPEVVAEADNWDRLIKKKLGVGEASLYDVAVALEWFKSNQTYRTYGYKSFAELADKRYGIKKSEAYNYIGVIERFSESDICKPYSMSQLIAALPLTDFEIFTYLKPGMSVREIKKIVKNLVKPPPAEVIQEAAPAPAAPAAASADGKKGHPGIKNLSYFLNVKNVGDFDSLSSEFFKILEKELKTAFLEGACALRLNLEWGRENPKQPGVETINGHAAQQQETKNSN